jgi:glycosyltransferase involved in cell wall biosynthesis
MGSDIQFSVIIPAYQAEGTIDRCLQALEHQTVPRGCYEIVVVDDGSKDDIRTRVQAYDGVHLFVQAHTGPAAARNLGVQHAQGEIVLFTDADCEPTEEWIEGMVAPLCDDRIVGVKGAYLTDQKEIVARFVQLEYEERYHRLTREACIDFVDTYAAGYRRKVLVDAGGFDPIFTEASVEDQELSFRLARLGHRMAFVPQARVYHWGHSRNLWAYCRRKFKIGYWKVWIASRYPEKIWRDSYTPPALKAQILLLGLGGICLVAAVWWPPLWWGVTVSALSFLATTRPFAARAWGRDPIIAILSPVMLLVRAMALGIGFASGLSARLGSRNHSNRFKPS